MTHGTEPNNTFGCSQLLKFCIIPSAADRRAANSARLSPCYFSVNIGVICNQCSNLRQFAASEALFTMSVCSAWFFWWIQGDISEISMTFRRPGGKYREEIYNVSQLTWKSSFQNTTIGAPQQHDKRGLVGLTVT